MSMSSMRLILELGIFALNFNFLLRTHIEQNLSLFLCPTTHKAKYNSDKSLFLLTLVQVRHACDTSNFDHFPPGPDDVPPDDHSGWDTEFGQLQQTPKWCLPGR